MLKGNDLRERTLEDLRELEKTLTHDVFQNRFKNFTNRLDDTSAIRKAKKDLARVKTILSQKAIGAASIAEAAAVAAAPPVEAPKPKAPKKVAAPKVAAKAAPVAPPAPAAAKKSATKKTAKKSEAE
jgi:large subunit ribosomal protein L29